LYILELVDHLIIIIVTMMIVMMPVFFVMMTDILVEDANCDTNVNLNDDNHVHDFL